MSTRLVAGTLRASRSSHLQVAIPPQRRLSRLSLVGCLTVILSMVQWSVVDRQHRDPSSSACGQSERKFAVLAFQPPSSLPQRHGQPFTAHRFPKRSPSVPTSLFFFDKDSNEIRFPRARTHIAKRYHEKLRNKISSSPLFGGSSNENGDPPSGNKNNKNRLKSMRRVGGRSRQRRKKDVDDRTIEKSSSSSSSSNFIEQIKNRLPSVPLLLVTLLVLNLLKNLFFGGGDEDYYYYSYSSSTVYETQTNFDGTREVFRKENSDLKTNIPGFTTRDAADRSGAGNFFYFDE